MINKLKKLYNHRKWKLYLYYNGILIKTLRIYENEAPTENSYVINVWYKKQIFKNNKVNIIVRPKVLLKNDEKNKKTYWRVVLEEGTII
jgi:hypothetical protein